MEELIKKIDMEIKKLRKENEEINDEYVSGIIYGLNLVKDIIKN